MSGNTECIELSPEAFQEIIMERRADMKRTAEQKRLHDLKRIQELNSKEGIGPLQLFPKEIWQMILELLRPEERQHMWQLHETFRDVMESSNLRDNLFPQILKLEVNQFWGKCSEKNEDDEVQDEASENEVQDDGSVDEEEQNESSVEIEEYVEDDTEEEDVVVKAPLANYLELRQVSKSLRNGIDRCIEEDLLRTLHQGESLCDPAKTITFGIQDMDELNRALDFVKTKPRIISRSLTIQMLAYEKLQQKDLNLFVEFMSKVTRFLEHVGDQILHFDLHVMDIGKERDENEIMELDCYIAEWFLLLPNLKWLKFAYDRNGLSRSCFGIQGFLNHPPPKLESLERLEFHTLGYTSSGRQEAEALCGAFISANPHIKNLHIIEAGEMIVPSVKTLQLEILSLIFRQRLSQTSQMMNSSWKLKRLVLECDMEGDSIARAFQLLEQFPSLEKVSLEIKNAAIGDDVNFLKLPQLTEFILHISPTMGDSVRNCFFFSLQFLLHSKKLKKLDWTNTSKKVKEMKAIFAKESEQPGSMIEFNGRWKDLTSSNIWMVFPYLDYVNVNVMDINKEGKLMKKVYEYRNRKLLFEQAFPCFRGHCCRR